MNIITTSKNLKATHIKSFALFLLTIPQIVFSQEFNEVSGNQIQGLYLASIDYSDIDGDGDLDLVQMGFDGSQVAFTEIYLNNGCGIFTLDPSNSLLGLGDGSVVFSDFDGDGDDDLLVTGRTNMNGVPDSRAVLYQNTGLNSGAFSVTAANLLNVGGIAEVADFDGDNDLDILLCYNTTKLFLNNGSWSFTQHSGNPFTSYYSSAVAGDIDNDTDMDLFLTKNGQAKVYANDGNANFTEITGNNIQWVYSSTADFFDSDNDGDLDLYVTGVNTDNGYTRTANLYQNNGSGLYSKITSTNFIGYQEGVVSIADFNKDGKKDILISGSADLSPSSQANIYTNLGENNFQLDYSNQLAPLAGGVNCVLDIDSDGDEDIVLTIFDGSYSSKVFKNDIEVGIDNIDACGPYTWINGITYNTDAVAYYAIPNATQNGCDSTVKMNLTIEIPQSTQNIVACETYTWIDGNTYTAKTSTSHTIINGSYMGCDSIVYLEIAIETPSPSTDIVITKESSHTWIDGNTYTTSGSSTASYFIATEQGSCQNEIILDLTLNETGVNLEDEPEFKWVQHVEETTTDPSCVWPYTIHSTFMNNGDLVLFSRGSGNINGTCPVLIGGQEVSNVDGFLARISKNGQLIWAKSEGEIGGPVSKITTDDANNIYCYQNLSPINQIKKLDSNGNELSTFGLQGKHASINSFFVKNSSIYLAGLLNKYIYDSDPVIFGLPIPTANDALIVKINSTTGVVEFAGSVEGGGSSVVSGMDLDAQGNIYIGGDFSSTNDFDLGAGTQVFDAPFGSYNPELDQSGTVYLAKYNPAFELQWVKQFRTSGTSVQRVKGLKKDPTGNFIYLAGEYRSTIDLDPSAGSTVFNTNSKLNFFFAKYDLSGNLIWGKDNGEDENDLLEAMDIDNSGNLLLGGSTNVRPITHPTNPSWTIAKADIEIQKYRGSDGVLTWKKSFTSEYSLNQTDDRNSIRGLSSTANGGFVAVGTFTRTMDFDDDVSYVNKTFNSSNGNGLSGHDLFFMSYGNISPCSETLTLSSPENDVTTGLLDFETNSTTGYINANNKLSAGTQSTYRAGRYIQLNPGFVANNGAIFKTEFGGCEE